MSQETSKCPVCGTPHNEDKNCYMTCEDCLQVYLYLGLMLKKAKANKNIPGLLDWIRREFDNAGIRVNISPNILRPGQMRPQSHEAHESGKEKVKGMGSTAPGKRNNSTLRKC